MKKIFITTVILLIELSGLTMAQWLPQNNPIPNSTIRDIYVINETTAIAVGAQDSNGGIILKTTNGINWITLPIDSTDYIRSVFFVSNIVGWITGSGYSEKAIQKTTDGGFTWTGQYGGYSFSAHSIQFVNENTGWAGCSYDGDGLTYNHIMKSTDGGTNWITQNLSADFVYFIGSNTGWAVHNSNLWGGGPATILKTTDTGNNWIIQPEIDYRINSIHFVDQNIGWIAGWDYNTGSNMISKTTNGGATWDSQFTSVTNSFNDIYFVDSNIGWTVGSGGIILHTTNGGINWIGQSSSTTSNLNSVHFANENVGWAVGENGTILKTTNGGTIPVELTSFTATVQNGFVELNWTTATEINNHGFEVQRSLNNSEFAIMGFVEGHGTTTEEHHYSYKDKDVSGILRYRLKQVDYDGSYEYSDIVEVEVFGITSYELSQNYPNPFNPVTNISYTLPTESQVKVSIYNPLGELVETIVNEKQNARKYDAVWNAGKHPSGVYIYTLDAVSVDGNEQKKLSKKMILLK